ncbi:MAG: LPS export ABC transporter periplasmic protein LptC [Desulfobacteraceae bacterium]|nr:LPS export ABC transporter periplasmic protein LptC [Desulfobacteraceae bacterium]MBU4000926.1 LPS export ABC transporter periplasmic protein LptC [Pseudomonadota bacterium]MBU4055727.1 LPS export ABC transporter periplasmic protein LptC [Pseudomonadota bacterium]
MKVLDKISFKTITSGKLKLILLLMIILGFGLTLWAFLISMQQTDNEKGSELTGSSPRPTLAIDKISHTATRDGKTEWSLEAGSAEYFNEEKKAVLKNIAIIFYMENNSTARISASEGVLLTSTNDIRISGDVILQNGDYGLKTDSLNYNHEKRLIYSNKPVDIRGETFHLTADEMAFDLASGKTKLKGHVKGIFGETI